MIGLVGAFALGLALLAPSLAMAQSSSSSSSSSSGSESFSGDGGGAGSGVGGGSQGTPGGIGGATTSPAASVGGMIGGDMGERIILIDVRPKTDFAKGHLRGAKNLDIRYSNVMQDYSFDKSVLGTDKSKQIVVYGASANDQAAAAVVRQAVAEGFTNVVWMRGGFSEWVAARLPTTTS